MNRFDALPESLQTYVWTCYVSNIFKTTSYELTARSLQCDKGDALSDICFILSLQLWPLGNSSFRSEHLCFSVSQQLFDRNDILPYLSELNTSRKTSRNFMSLSNTIEGLDLSRCRCARDTGSPGQSSWAKSSWAKCFDRFGDRRHTRFYEDNTEPHLHDSDIDRIISHFAEESGFLTLGEEESMLT
jgi:hypothetical protein